MEKKIGRKTKVLSLLLTSMLVMSAAALMLISVGNAANGGPYIEVQPDSQSVDPGDPFSVDIHVDSDTYNLKAVNFYVLYDSSTFSVDSWTYTNLLGPSVLAIPIDDPGNFSYSIVRTDGSEVPVGDSLLTIDFSVDAGASGGSYPLDLHDDLRDENNNPIPSISVYDVNVVVAGGHLQVDAGGPYSGIVNSSITFYASASGGTPPYSYEWDFDYDGIFTADGKGESISNCCSLRAK